MIKLQRFVELIRFAFSEARLSCVWYLPVLAGYIMSGCACLFDLLYYRNTPAAVEICGYVHVLIPKRYLNLVGRWVSGHAVPCRILLKSSLGFRYFGWLGVDPGKTADKTTIYKWDYRSAVTAANCESLDGGGHSYLSILRTVRGRRDSFFFCPLIYVYRVSWASIL